jgi:hypothetical protein
VLKLRRDLDFRIVRVRVQLHKKIGDRYSSGFYMLIAQIEGCGDRIKLDIKGRTAIQSRDRHVPASITGATKHLSFSLLGPTCTTHVWMLRLFAFKLAMLNTCFPKSV